MKSILQAAKDLNHHSLQSYIIEVTEKTDVFSYSQLLQHPQINTIRPEYLSMLKLFVYDTLVNYSKREGLNKELTEKQMEKLKKLSILSYFEGMTQVSLSALTTFISASKLQTIRFLMELNIQGNIQIEINQEKDIISILYAEVRGKQWTQKQAIEMQEKVKKIQQKNEKLAIELQNQIKKAKKNPEKSNIITSRE